MKKIKINIDTSKCIGCGACAQSCHMGVIEMRNGKAYPTHIQACDGLGKCLKKCPVDALSLVEVEVPQAKSVPVKTPPASCPGMRVQDLSNTPSETCLTVNVQTQLRQWPVQLHLVPVDAPYLKGADLLICADCVMAAYGDFQALLKGKKLLIACPKLDETDSYKQKLIDLFQFNHPHSLTIAIMEVPCCSMLERLVLDAVKQSGVSISVKTVVISIRGDVKPS